VAGRRAVANHPPFGPGPKAGALPEWIALRACRVPLASRARPHAVRFNGPTIAPAFPSRSSRGKEQMMLVGRAAAGFPIYAAWDHRDAANAASGRGMTHLKMPSTL
jgi:hypothetical protein